MTSVCGTAPSTRIENLVICTAALEKALFVYPKDHLEMRQGARIILKSKEDVSR